MTQSTAKTLTILFGAIPGTIAAGLAMISSAIAAAETESPQTKVFLSVLAILGAAALWRAALGPVPVRWPTALGLLCGPFAVIGYSNLDIYIMAIFLLLPALVVMPFLAISASIVAVCHILFALRGLLSNSDR